MAATTQLAPVALFVYNRPQHTDITLEALAKSTLAAETPLYIFSDAAKSTIDEEKVAEVRSRIQAVKGFLTINIIERERNLGLANSIISGATTLLKKYGRVIVLEDDLVVSPFFLKFMNDSLDFYARNKKVQYISGFSFARDFMKFERTSGNGVYFHYRPMSWSWATWHDRWQDVDWDISDYETFLTDHARQKRFERGGKDLTAMLAAQIAGRIDSWYIRWCYDCSKKGSLNVYPKFSFINNIGHDGTGVHCGSNPNDAIYAHQDMADDDQWVLDPEPQINAATAARFRSAFSRTFWQRVRHKIRKIFGIEPDTSLRRR